MSRDPSSSTGANENGEMLGRGTGGESFQGEDWEHHSPNDPPRTIQDTSEVYKGMKARERHDNKGKHDDTIDVGEIKAGFEWQERWSSVRSWNGEIRWPSLEYRENHHCWVTVVW